LISTTLSSRQAAEVRGIRPWRVVRQTLDVVVANAKVLIRSIRLAALLMFATVLSSLKIYFTCLASYWQQPSVRTASIAVSSVVVGVVLSALAVAIASSNVTRAMPGGPAVPQLRGLEARMFAAILRLLAIGAVGLAFIGACAAFAGAHLPSGLARYSAWCGWSVALLFVAVMSVRCGFLAPVLAATERRSVLRRGWSLSSGHGLSIAIVWLVLTVLPALVLQVLGEIFILRFADASFTTLAQGAERLAADNLALVAIAFFLVAAAVASSVMTTLGSFALARDLVRRT